MAVKLEIMGMTCDHCVGSVEKALAAVPGVAMVVEVNRERGEAIVEGNVSSDALIAAVVGEGFEAKAAS